MLLAPLGGHMKRGNQTTAKEAYEMLQRGDAVDIIDVRQPEEYREAHIVPSRLIPLGELSRRGAELEPLTHAADALPGQNIASASTAKPSSSLMFADPDHWRTAVRSVFLTSSALVRNSTPFR